MAGANGIRPSCRCYPPKAKPARKSHWGSRLLQRDGGSGGKGAGRKGVAPGQQVAERFRRANGAKASDWEANR